MFLTSYLSEYQIEYPLSCFKWLSGILQILHESWQEQNNLADLILDIKNFLPINYVSFFSGGNANILFNANKANDKVFFLPGLTKGMCYTLRSCIGHCEVQAMSCM